MLAGERFFRFGTNVAGRLRVKSALNPVLWLVGIVTIPIVGISLTFGLPLPLWLSLLACAPVATAIFGFCFLLIYDRDKLQSEDFQLRKRSLEIVQEKGGSIEVLATSVEAITNPTSRALEDRRG